MSVDDLRARLSRFGQEHLLAFWDGLSADSRDKLAGQISRIDFEQIAALVQGHDAAPDWAELAAQAKSPRAIRLDATDNEFSAEQARTRGEEILQAGQLGLILVAGGQGTRLGFDHPKGMFPIGPVSGRTLFQVLIERLRAVARRYGVSIPMYVMTSPATHDETVAFLDQHDRFGLASEDLRIFCQGTMPAVEARSGKLLLAATDSLALSPDGHGGMLSAFCQSGCMADAQARQIEHLFYCQIDNPLAQIGDPGLIGYHALASSDMTTQVVQKRFATERVGNVVELDGRTQIIEYSDLPEKYAEQKTTSGSLLLWAGNLAIHIMRRRFLEKVAAEGEALPFHRALKAVPHVDAEGTTVSPESPNAVKFERFIFDLLPLAENAIVVESKASAAFAPVKNADGADTDTPATAKAAMLAYDAKLLTDAGLTLGEGVEVEVSPMWALDPEEASRQMPAGTVITKSQFLGPRS